jgi:autotransporter-associated beta strand protein
LSTTSAVVTLNGGSIEGFMKVDDNVRTSNAAQGAVYRIVGSGVSFTLAGNSFLGQNINQGLNGYDNGAQPTPFSPFANAATGVLLEIKGAIGGPGSLTKQGYDTVTLSGANSYLGGTNLVQGMLRIGANDSLPVTGNVSTTGASVLDLNGFNQTIGRLTSPSDGLTAATTNLTGSGTTQAVTLGAQLTSRFFRIMRACN